MKTSAFLSVFLLSLFSFTNLNAERQLHRFLEFSGIIYKTGFDAKGTEKFLENALVVVANEETGTADTIYSGDNGEYYFRLPLDNMYMITVSKDSFATKKIHVDTHLPLFAKGKHSMEFELSLYNVVPGMDYSLLNEPVAQIRFDKDRKGFDYDHAYTDRLNRDLKKMYFVYFTKNVIVKAPERKTKAVVSMKKKRKAKVITLHW